ncbi:unnamed protein product [Gongylonema pulchrum]|uniref:Uncharacterized protein n=1 Tax=Gongylonema pulchrum TaxID=637853 RepID=A0A3P7NRE4_9BILA|nr:unnamed protein product [Gongylonema pulchrum]
MERLKTERAKLIEEMNDDVRKELRDLYRKPKSKKNRKS